MSPRIAWLSLMKCAGWTAKLVTLLAVLAGIAWGAWLGIQRAFHHNPDFHLQVIALNPNTAIDEFGLISAAGIDLTASPSLFDLDIEELERKIKCLPAIAKVRAERHLPGTLSVTVTPRVPKAWISCSPTDLSDTRHVGDLLVDQERVAYPCPELQMESARTLPVIRLFGPGSPSVKAGDKIPQSALEFCFLLLDAARDADEDAPQWIESVRQVNEWSLLLVTRKGTSATMGLWDHERQIQSLRAAMDHATEKGYLIDTINLIPKYNIPITLCDDAPPPPRAIPVSILEATGANLPQNTRDPLPQNN